MNSVCYLDPKKSIMFNKVGTYNTISSSFQIHAKKLSREALGSFSLRWHTLGIKFCYPTVNIYVMAWCELSMLRLPHNIYYSIKFINKTTKPILYCFFQTVKSRFLKKLINRSVVSWVQWGNFLLGSGSARLE